MSKGSTRTQCLPPTPTHVVLLAFAFAPALLVVPISYFGCRESLSLKPKSLRIVYWMTSFLLLIGTCSWPFHELCDFEFSGLCTNWDRNIATNIFAVFSYMASLVCICGVYSVRMVSSFQSSKYSTSTRTIIFFIFGILIQSVLVVLCVYSNYVAWYSIFNQNMDDMLLWAWRYFALFNAFGALNLSYNIILLILFLSKVHRISGSMDDKDKPAYDASLFIMIDRVIEPAAIYALCLCIAFVSTSVIFIFGLFRGNIVVDSNELYQTHLTLVCWDILINVVTLHLQFNAAKPFVIKYCGCGVDCFVQTFVKRMMRNDDELKIKQRRKKLTVSSDSSITTGNTTGTTKGTAQCTAETSARTFVTCGGESYFLDETVSFIRESQTHDATQLQYLVSLNKYGREWLVHGFVRKYYPPSVFGVHVPFVVTECILKLFDNDMVMMVHLEHCFVDVFQSMYGCDLRSQIVRNVMQYYNEKGYEWEQIMDDCQQNCCCMHSISETLALNRQRVSHSKKKELRQLLQKRIH